VARPALPTQVDERPQIRDDDHPWAAYFSSCCALREPSSAERDPLLRSAARPRGQPALIFSNTLYLSGALTDALPMAQVNMKVMVGHEN
jgi:hypothetical protein